MVHGSTSSVTKPQPDIKAIAPRSRGLKNREIDRNIVEMQ